MNPELLNKKDERWRVGWMVDDEERLMLTKLVEVWLLGLG
jgi:hypothetical protein